MVGEHLSIGAASVQNFIRFPSSRLAVEGLPRVGPIANQSEKSPWWCGARGRSACLVRHCLAAHILYVFTVFYRMSLGAGLGLHERF
jgi:hypothetical protein